MTDAVEYRDEVPTEDGTYRVQERASGHLYVAEWFGGVMRTTFDGLVRDPSEFRWGPPVGELYAW